MSVGVEKWVWLLVTFTLLFCPTAITSITSAFAADKAPCTPWIARVESAQGGVEVRRAGEARWYPVTLGATLCAGDGLRVKRRSRAAIVERASQTVVRLDQDSAIMLPAPETDGVSVLELLRGIAHFLSRAPTAWKVTTPFVNAYKKGTEFLVRVDPNRTTIFVFDGVVQAQNRQGQLNLKSGQVAVAKRNERPILELAIRPTRDAVFWALHYPSLIDFRSASYEQSMAAPIIKKAIEQYRQGRLLEALATLDAVLSSQRDSSYYGINAGLLLSVGRVDEASRAIDAMLHRDPEDPTALALQSVIAVVSNEKDKALALAKRAVASASESPIPRIALSYAHQASFDIDQAYETISELVGIVSDNALLWARLSELALSRGELDEALGAASKAVALEPALARTQTVLGYAYLTQIDTPKAKAAFTKAIALSPSAPLQRLGLGLAQIRAGDLDEGTRQIEIAASLDPNRAIVRSYLGKAYYEQKRANPAATELDNAKELDPSDPTPWFYDAILKQTTNRPVEALYDLDRAIALNDNRAVYRSSLLLDQDLAARSASLGRIYRDLGFEQRALVEGWNSLNADPANHSAHRLLADSYIALPRRGIARASELLQAQLLQPTNITPVQPQLAETSLSILEEAGPAELSLNEYNPLFNRNRLAIQASGIVGSHDTYGDELVHSGVWEGLSYSLGQFHYETAGIRANNDLRQDIYDVFAQGSVSYRTSVQMELRHTDSEEGDRGDNFFRADFNPSFRGNRTTETARLGFHHMFSPRSELIGSLIYKDTEGDDKTRNFSAMLNEEAYLIEGQHQYRRAGWSFVSGAGHFSTMDRKQEIRFPVITVSDETGIQHSNAYLYSYINHLNTLNVILGISVNFFKGTLVGTLVEREQVNPKFGLTWMPLSGTTLRMAAFRVLEPGLSIAETIEPTQVAGFNQFYGTGFEQDIENAARQGFDTWQYGIAIDQKLYPNLYVGSELAKRDLNVPGAINGRRIEDEWREYLGRAYLYFSPYPTLAANLEYRFERFELGVLTGGRPFREVDTHLASTGLSFFHPTGAGAELKATFIDQSGLFGPTGRRPGEDKFWVVDAAVQYRLPRRLGLITFGAQNLFNEKFNFLEIDPTTPAVQRDRMIFGRVTLTF